MNEVVVEKKGKVMVGNYSRERILQTVDKAKACGVWGDRENIGEALLVAIHDTVANRDEYKALFDRLGLKFGERLKDEVHDEIIPSGIGARIAYSIRENGVNVILSSDEELNVKVVKELQLDSGSMKLVTSQS